MVLTVLSGFKSRDVDLAAASAIEALLAQKDVPWWIPDALRLTLARFGDPDPDGRISHLGADFDEINAEEARRVWRNACSALNIPRVAPAAAPEIEMSGVGPNTPS